MRLFAVALLTLALSGTLAPARADTVGAVRAEVAALSAQVAELRALLAGGGSGHAAGIDGDILARADRIEAALASLTARTEELEFRVRRIAADAENRIGDLEFRLAELEGGDPSALAPTRPLGGDAASPARPQGADSDAPSLADSEQRAFDEARSAHDEGRFDQAAAAWAEFVTAYPDGPLTPEARFLRAEAEARRGDSAEAARLYLDLFVGAPQGARAAEALLALGQALSDLGQRDEACVMYEELIERFPASTEAQRATQARTTLACD